MAKLETHSFETEISQLLDLMINSLYSQKEIFLRELISNSSDAIDKRRFDALTDASLLTDDEELAIIIEVDKEAGTLSVSDNGIGMSRQEVVDNIGTIARSGTQRFVDTLKQQKGADQMNLIGQFGVGFYSVFMVADSVELVTRKAGSEEAVIWKSDGKGEYSIGETEKADTGTRISLMLREDEKDYLDDFRLRHIVNKYSEHISLPIKMWATAATEEQDDGDSEAKSELETVNSGTALWSRSKKEVSADEYNSFYQSLSYDPEPPLATLHHKVEGNLEYTSLLYIPSKAPFDLWNRDVQSGIKLYVRKIFIMDDAKHLMPSYLRFIKGVVDSADLPLNVSREILQSDRDILKIKTACVKRVLDELTRMSEKEPDQYANFWSEFGQVLKEGLVEDFANKEKLANLLRFSSTHLDKEEQSVSLKSYVERAGENENSIYYLTAENYQAAKGSPHLERFLSKGVEVLLLTDPVDEWVANSLTEFDGKTLKSVTKGEIELSDEEQAEQTKNEESLAEVTKQLQDSLSQSVKEVRVSHRLTESPACLVADASDPGANMERILKSMGQEAPASKPILEINPTHALIKGLDPESSSFADWAQVLFNQAALSEGGQLTDPAQYVKTVNKLLQNL